MAMRLDHVARAERQAANNRAWLERREAERAGLSIDERLLLATVSTWGNLTIAPDDRRVSVAMTLEAKGRVSVRREGDNLIITLPKMPITAPSL